MYIYIYIYIYIYESVCVFVWFLIILKEIDYQGGLGVDERTIFE